MGNEAVKLENDGQNEFFLSTKHNGKMSLLSPKNNGKMTLLSTKKQWQKSKQQGECK